MSPSVKTLALLGFPLFFTVLAFGQSGGWTFYSPYQSSAASLTAQNGGLGEFHTSVTFGPHPLTNAPYSAVEETEETQTLADGTHVVTKSHRRIYRDSAGRTRTEMFFPDRMRDSQQDVPLSIMINDPVAGTMYVLQPETHTAHLLKGPDLPPAAPRDMPVAAPPPKPVSDRPRPKVTTDDLGIQTIDGMQAQGRRITRTIPAGAEGNDGPIIVTDEYWNCPELQVQCLRTHSDPRTGKTVTHFTSLDRSEPDASLFQVPTDYKLAEDNAP
jgi:hypothetical protein